jgi:ketosteroid isomerase-like protein
MATTASPSLTQQLTELARRRADVLVRRDAEALDDMLAPDFVYTNSSGRVLKKQDYIQVVISATWISQQLSDVSVRDFGSTAILTGKVHDVADFDGFELNSDFRTTQVYIQTEDGWKYAAGHTSSLV